jgi:Right handed beta helix region
MRIASRVLKVGVVVGLLAALSIAVVSSARHEQATPEHLYVAPWGNDGWPGTEERPLATPAAAQQAVRERTADMDADIVVNLRGGTYTLTEPLRLSAADGDAGTGRHSVIYQAYGYGTQRQEVPVISGGRRVTGWQPAENVDGAWRAEVGGLETRQLYVDGRRAQRAALGAGLPGEAIRVQNGYATRNTVPQSWQRPWDMELVLNGTDGGLQYSEARCGVSRIIGDAEWSLIILDEPCWSNLKKGYAAEARWAKPVAPTDVENSLSLLREPGSWYLDRSRPGRHVLYYLPRRGEDPRRVPVVAPVLEQLVVGTGTPDEPLREVTFRGLTFSYATWLEPSEPAGFPQIIGSWIYSEGESSERMPGHVTLRAAERVTIEGNRFTHLGAQALVLSQVGSDNSVQGNTIDDVSGGGVELRGPGVDNRIEDNWVHHIGTDYRSSVGIAVEGSPDATVAHNQVNDVPYTGIWGQSSEISSQSSRGGLRIVNNLVFNAVGQVPDGGGIYLPFVQGTSFDDGAVVRGNVVHDAGDVGIYPDVGADWVTLERNVLHGSKDAVAGVEPKRIMLSDNYWDDDKPFWWPKSTPRDGIELADNTLLPRGDLLADCRADEACAQIIANAGPRKP